MKIKGQRVFLRDFIHEDIEDMIEWQTIETEWCQWDAPWEMEEEEPFNADAYRARMTESLSRERDPDRLRYGFQLCVDDETKKHIGWVNAYFIDENYRYIKGKGNLTIGNDIPDMASRRKAYATEAWRLYIRYLLDHGIKEIYTQTWSGNVRVLGLMNKIGFIECYREKDFRTVRGQLFDGLTLKLNVDSFIMNQ